MCYLGYQITLRGMLLSQASVVNNHANMLHFFKYKFSLLIAILKIIHILYPEVVPKRKLKYCCLCVSINAIIVLQLKAIMKISQMCYKNC